jgi:hypothetical protein
MTLTATRRKTSRLLRGIELPDCFAAATVAAEAAILARAPSDRRAADAADLRRLSDKARRVTLAKP